MTGFDDLSLKIPLVYFDIYEQLKKNHAQLS